MNVPILQLLTLSLGLTLAVSCSSTSDSAAAQEDFFRKGDELEAATKNKRISRTFEAFIASPTYRITRDYWRGGALNQYDPANSHVEILLEMQRGRLYINDTIAMDFPVSTGTVDQHDTPRGTFRITEKKREHHSSLYGSFVDAQGNAVKRKVRSTDAAPAGSRFEGTLMEYWMRFNGAIGMHTGKIEREAESHGCVRIPPEACSILFDKLAIGSKVIVK